MPMDPIGGNVFDVVVPREWRHPFDPILRILADTIGVANVEIQSDPRRLDPLHELQMLTERFDHQLRLRLDQQQHLQFLGQFDAGHQLVVEDPRAASHV